MVSRIAPDYLEASITKLTAHAGQMNGRAANSMVLKLNTDKGSIKEMTWVPPSLKQQEIFPENIATFGGPWLLRTVSGQSRHGAVQWPFWGFGQFVIGIRGTGLVISWPMAVARDLAVGADKSMDIMSLMSRAQFNAQLDNFFHCLVRPKQAIWIPYGHCPLYIGLQDSEDNVSFAMTVPYMATKLVNDMVDSERALLATTLRGYMQLPVTQERPWSVIGPAALAFLGADIQPDNDHESDGPEDGAASDGSTANMAEIN